MTQQFFSARWPLGGGMGGDEVIRSGRVHRDGVQADGGHRQDEERDQQHARMFYILQSEIKTSK